MVCFQPVELNKLISDLISSGLSQQALADELRQRNPDLTVTQATISRLQNGKRRSTSFELGHAIAELHRRRMRRSRAA